jgi:hypothetical protein
MKKKKKLEELIGSNIYSPPITVNHAELERTDSSEFRSVCPVCEIGTLLVKRDQISLILLPEDQCILCGQHFVYRDIDGLRKAEKI